MLVVNKDAPKNDVKGLRKSIAHIELNICGFSPEAQQQLAEVIAEAVVAAITSEKEEALTSPYKPLSTTDILVGSDGSEPAETATCQSYK